MLERYWEPNLEVVKIHPALDQRYLLSQISSSNQSY